MNKLLIKITDDTLNKDKLTELYNDQSKKMVSDSGFDLFIPKSINTYFGTMIKIDHGIACAMFDDKDKPTGYILAPRSGIIKTAYRMANSIGIIDSGYRGNIIAAVDSNISETIPQYVRMFQLVAPDFQPIKCEIVDELPDSIRGKKGFGSTGK